METNKPTTTETIPPGTEHVLEIEGKKCYLKKMSRPVMETALGLIMPTSGAPKYITAGEIIINAKWKGGDEEFRKNEDLFAEACLTAIKLIQRREAQLKKV